MLRNRILGLVAVSLTFALSGCGDGRPTRIPVSGKVLIDGQPLTIGAVRFIPEQGRPATGTLGSDGSFTLGTFETSDGVVPGSHVVTVHASEEISTTLRRWNTPRKYENPNTSGLSRNIEGPTDSVVIELTWDGQKGPFLETIPLE